MRYYHSIPMRYYRCDRYFVDGILDTIRQFAMSFVGKIKDIIKRLFSIFRSGQVPQEVSRPALNIIRNVNNSASNIASTATLTAAVSPSTSVSSAQTNIPDIKEETKDVYSGIKQLLNVIKEKQFNPVVKREAQAVTYTADSLTKRFFSEVKKAEYHLSPFLKESTIPYAPDNKELAIQNFTAAFSELRKYGADEDLILDPADANEFSKFMRGQKAGGAKFVIGNALRKLKRSYEALKEENQRIPDNISLAYRKATGKLNAASDLLKRYFAL